MINSLMGLKLNMTARFDKWGHRVPVTLIKADPNVILSQKDGKVELGFSRKKNVKKTQNAYVKIAGFAPRFIKKVSIQGVPDAENIPAGFSTGDKISVSVFAPGDLVKVAGITKGKGFAGGVKRWGFAGGPKTHGQSDRHRALGSIGQTTTPGRVFKGKKMAGHMGASKKTINNLEIFEVDSENNLLVIKGSVPGARRGLLLITKTGKAKGYTPPPPKVKEENGQEVATDDKSQKETVKKSPISQDKEKENATEKH